VVAVLEAGRRDETPTGVLGRSRRFVSLAGVRSLNDRDGK
jgi:hypothetical protein